MSEYFKIVSLVLLSVVLGLSIGKTEKDISTVLEMVSLCIAACAAATVLEPVLNYLVELRRVFNLPDELVNVLLKAVGIALTAELSAAVCRDAGSASMGKILQILGGATVLSLSIPMFRTLMTIIKEMSGGI